VGLIRVLLVEDDQLARQFLNARLSLEPDLAVVASAADGDAALEALRQETVDVVVLDYHLVGVSGLHLLRAVLRGAMPAGDDRPPPRVLFCTGWATAELECEARAAGASGVVSKTEAGQQLPAAIRAVASGASWFPATTGAAPASADRAPWRVLIAEPDRASRALLNEALRQLGCTVNFAWNGRGAMEHLESDEYDLCLLSHRLPGPPRATDVLEEMESRWPALRVLLVESNPSHKVNLPSSVNVRGLIASPSDARLVYEQALLALRS
jgi:DNA-binding NarL/FixJ family response regulator